MLATYKENYQFFISSAICQVTLFLFMFVPYCDGYVGPTVLGRPTKFYGVMMTSAWLLNIFCIFQNFINPQKKFLAMLLM